MLENVLRTALEGKRDAGGRLHERTRRRLSRLANLAQDSDRVARRLMESALQLVETYLRQGGRP